MRTSLLRQAGRHAAAALQQLRRDDGLAQAAAAAAGASGAPTRPCSTAAPPPPPPPEHTVDCVVVGAGVIGLAVARAAALAGAEVVVLEEAAHWGSGTSSRSSEVIHAGLYYPPGSLKAAACVEGRARLYEYAALRGVAHARLGKLVVATDKAQLPQLRRLAATAAANGVADLALLSAAEVAALEPALAPVAAALLSPSTGILDSHGFMAALLEDAQDAGALLATHSRVLGITPALGQFGSAAPGAGGSSSSGGASASASASAGAPPRHLLVDVQDTCSGAVTRLATRWLVNAAGLGAASLRVAGLPPSCVPRTWLAKGSYFALAGGRPPFSRLVYPLPEPGGLGVHLTLDLAGAARFGPDVEWVAAAAYDVDPARAAAFYPAVRRYWPGLADGALAPAYAGVRPKLSGPGQPAADFLLLGPAQHGVAGLVGCFGIESPGLTASLALADEVLARLRGGGGA